MVDGLQPVARPFSVQKIKPGHTRYTTHQTSQVFQSVFLELAPRCSEHLLGLGLVVVLDAWCKSSASNRLGFNVPLDIFLLPKPMFSRTIGWINHGKSILFDEQFQTPSSITDSHSLVAVVEIPPRVQPPSSPTLQASWQCAVIEGIIIIYTMNPNHRES